LENEDSKGKGQEKHRVDVRWGNKTRSKEILMITQTADMRGVKKQMMMKGKSSYFYTHMTPPTYRGNSRFSSFRGGPDVPLIGGPPSSWRTPSWLSLLTFTECHWSSTIGSAELQHTAHPINCVLVNSK
jgi:hypothetical protein